MVDVDRNLIVLGVKEYVETPAFVLSGVYLIDLIANMLTLKFKVILKTRKFLVLEIFLQISYWTTFFIDIAVKTGEDSNLARFTRINAIFMIRNLRVLDLLAELKEFQIIITTMKSLTAPIISKLLFLYVVFYLYAIVG